MSCAEVPGTPATNPRLRLEAAFKPNWHQPPELFFGSL
jgi:hypothetical protein